MKHIYIILLTGLSLASVAVVWTPSIPLGVPGEWEWQRHSGFSELAEFLDRFIPAIVGGLPLFAVAVTGHRRLQSARPVRIAVQYTALMCVAWFWLNQVQQTTPALHRSLKPYWVLYDKSSSGYFYEAAFEIESVSEFLNNYEDRMKEGEVLHIGTHPPGLFLLSRFCIEACERSPTLRWLLNGFEDREVRTAFRTVEAEAKMNRQLTNVELAGLHLLSSLTTFAVVLTIVPIAVIICSLNTRAAAWQACCLWPTLPCLAIFLPKSDLLFPLTCTTALMFCVLAMNGRSRILSAVCCGATLWCGLLLSLAHLPVIVLIGLLMILRAIISRFSTFKTDAIVLTSIMATIGLLTLLWTILTDCNLLAVWQLNFQNHEGFYRQFTRTWWKWLLVNPLELSMAVGPAIAVSAATVLYRTINDVGHAGKRDQDKLEQPVLLAAVGTIAMLWLSGKNQGEAARLWCFLTPWLMVIMLSHRIQVCKPEWRKLMAIQILVATFLVSRVNGFSF